METQMNCKGETVFGGQTSGFGDLNMKGVNMDFDKEMQRQEKEMQGYSQPPIKLRNFITGKPQKVLTGLDPSELNEKLHFSDKAYNGPVALRIDDFPMEFKADVWRALRRFNKRQQTFLLNVLVRGMSIEIAAKLTNRSKSHWQDWLTKIALPALREVLADYAPNGKLTLS